MSKYSVLYADPAWNYGGRTQHNGVSAVKSAEDHYNTMTLQQLKEIKIQEKTEKDAILFLWTSSPHLAQALELMNAWGFEYKTIAFDTQRKSKGKAVSI
jgi:N6-adenosine-specific RNA methylase IME4